MLVLMGLALAVQHLTGVGDLLGSAYGRILLLKLGLVVGALLLGLAATCPRGPVPRACHALCARKVTKRASMRMAKARKCRPARVSGKRS